MVDTVMNITWRPGAKHIRYKINAVYNVTS